jgi:hypothetical protein
MTYKTFDLLLKVTNGFFSIFGKKIVKKDFTLITKVHDYFWINIQPLHKRIFNKLQRRLNNLPLPVLIFWYYLTFRRSYARAISYVRDHLMVYGSLEGTIDIAHYKEYARVMHHFYKKYESFLDEYPSQGIDTSTHLIGRFKYFVMGEILNFFNNKYEKIINGKQT